MGAVSSRWDRGTKKNPSTSAGLGTIRASAPLSTTPSTGCIRKLARWAMKSSRPSNLTQRSGMPSSSQVSRRAHASGVSPGSISPPGKQTSPGWRRKVDARTS